MTEGHLPILTDDLFRTIFEKSPGSILVTADKPRFTIQAVSDSYLEITSSKRDEIVGRGFFEVFPDDLDFNEETKARIVFTKVIETGQKITVPTYRYDIFNNQLKQYEAHYWSCLNTPIFDNAGTVAYILNTVIDISEEVRAKNAAIENEHRLRIAAEAAAFGTWELELKTQRFVYAPRIAEIFGHAADAQPSLTDLRAQIHADDMQNVVLKALDVALSTGKYLYEVRISWPDGSLHWIRTQGILMYEDKEPRSILGTILDITESKRDEIRKNDFIAMASHELKTPLTSLKGYLHIISKKTEYLKDSFLNNALSRADYQVSRMARLIHGFLDLSGIEPGKLKLQLEEFDINRLTEETISETLLIHPGRAVRLNGSASVLVKADRDKIGRVISNFLSNAIKYSPANTEILVIAAQDEGYVRISVADQGIGVKAKEKEKIFQRFYRGDNEKTGQVSGFGIGLYLSSEIIQSHNGSIGVESVENKGSTFYFTLPLVS